MSVAQWEVIVELKLISTEGDEVRRDKWGMKSEQLEWDESEVEVSRS